MIKEIVEKMVEKIVKEMNAKGVEIRNMTDSEIFARDRARLYEGKSQDEELCPLTKSVYRKVEGDFDTWDF